MSNTIRHQLRWQTVIRQKATSHPRSSPKDLLRNRTSHQTIQNHDVELSCHQLWRHQQKKNSYIEQQKRIIYHTIILITGTREIHHSLQQRIVIRRPRSLPARAARPRALSMSQAPSANSRGYNKTTTRRVASRTTSQRMAI